MRKIFISILLSINGLIWASNIVLSEQSMIQLLTCTPGTETWSKYGHTAVRVTDVENKLDIVFNYGIFDLMADNFYLKFIRGETYYQLGVDRFSTFHTFYRNIGRTTYWQELNLTLLQRQQIFDALMVVLGMDSLDTHTGPYYNHKGEKVQGEIILNKYDTVILKR